MNPSSSNLVFFSYGEDTQDFAEALARRLYGDARLSFWFAPWHAVPGMPVQEQMEEALRQARSCAVFIGSSAVRGWQNEQMRTAIQKRVEDTPGYRIIPVFTPGAKGQDIKQLPGFLRRFESIQFDHENDEQSFKRLLAGILGLPPFQIDGFLQIQIEKEQLAPPSSLRFKQGHALVIGVANYSRIRPLSEVVLNDAQDLAGLLADPSICGYPEKNIDVLLDQQATGEGIRAALGSLSQRTGPEDTALIFFSGHGAQISTGEIDQQYILPFDCYPANLKSMISGEEFTERLREIKAGRLLVCLDCCHSGGSGELKDIDQPWKAGLGEEVYAMLAQGRGRVVIASCRPEEYSLVLKDMRNSVFTYYLLEALQGIGRTLGDGYVRVFDIFRHLAEHVPIKAQAYQHPIFKATAMDSDFPVALSR